MTEKEKQDQANSDLEWVSSTEQGRRFLWKLLSHCGIYRDIEGDTDVMLKQIGRRQVGLFLLGLIEEASEDRIFDMMREAKNRELEEKHERERNRITDTIDDIIGVEHSGELPDTASGGPTF